MADSAVEITTGSGANVDTRTEGTNGNHRQVIVIGDPATNAGVAPVDETRGLKVDPADVLADDAAFTPATSKVLPVGFEFDDAAPDSVDEGDIGAARMSSRREIYTQIRDGAGNERGAYVNASGQLAIVGPVTNAGTFAVQVDGNALTALQLIDDQIFADDAAFTPGTSKIGMIGAEFDDAAPDSVDEGDAGALRMSARRELYTQIRDGAGNERGAYVNASGQIAIAGPVTNAGTFAVQVDGNALTALQLIDDPIFVDDAAFTPTSSKVHMAGFEFDDAAPDSIDEGDAGAARMSANRNQYIQIRDAAGNERGVNVNASNQLAIAGPVTNAGTFVTQENGSALTALQLIDDPIFADDAAFTPGTSKVHMIGAEFDDTTPDSVDEGDAGAVRMSANRNLFVRIRDNAGNERGLNIDANGAGSVAGDIAHDSADGGNPQKIGFQARQTNPTAVADADRVNAVADDIGRQVVVLNQVRDLTIEAVLTITSDTAEKTLLAAAASTYHDLVSLVITNKSATATIVTLRDDTGAGTARVYAIPAGGGIVMNFPVPLKQGATNDNWTLQCGTSVDSIYAHAVFVKNI